MTLRNFFAHAIGVLFIASGFAWAGYDAASNEGRIAFTTAVGSLMLVGAGGFLFDKHLVAELLKWLFSQAKEFKSVLVGSVDEK